MITRRTARVLAETIAKLFRRSWGTHGRPEGWSPDPQVAYDFLFDNEYPAWFCNAAKVAATYSTSSTRYFQEFFMKLHTGESVFEATKSWTWEQREQLGQQLLKELGEDVLVRLEKTSHAYPAKPQELNALRSTLQLDGYEFKADKLIVPETDVLDTKEEQGVLETLYRELALANPDTASHHLKLSEEHYLAGRWDDSISNSRKFLELVLQETAAAHARSTGSPLTEDYLSRPAKVREHLERSGLLENKEREAVASVYGLLSETGSHPYMAAAEQARLLRHLALTLSQFVMLRLKGQMTA